MAKVDFYPETEGATRLFLDNLITQLADVSATLGLTAADVAAITAARNNLFAALADREAKQAAARAAVVHTQMVSRATEATIRAQVRRLKTHPAYTPVIGIQLGVDGAPGAGTGGASAGGTGGRPVLEAVSIAYGAVQLKYLKNGFSGVEIGCRRGAESEFTFLARDTESPYVDARANLTDAPETRHYRARYLHKDTPTADYSDVLVVTVPGKG